MIIANVSPTRKIMADKREEIVPVIPPESLAPNA